MSRQKERHGIGIFCLQSLLSNKQNTNYNYLCIYLDEYLQNKLPFCTKLADIIHQNQVIYYQDTSLQKCKVYAR